MNIYNLVVLLLQPTIFKSALVLGCLFSAAIVLVLPRVEFSAPRPSGPIQNASSVKMDMKKLVRPIGFTVIANGTDPIVDIILVPGLQGHPYRTWSTRESFWPHDFLPHDIPNARIITYGYDSTISKILGAVNRNTMYQHAKDLLFRLGSLREGCESRPIIFLLHSLGGIIGKEVLIRSRGAEYNLIGQPIFPATFGIIFFGTPHRGSGKTGWAEFLRAITAAAGIDTNPELIRTLEIDSAILDNNREGFAKLLRASTIRIHSFQEGKGMLGVAGLNGKVVDDSSSGIDDPFEGKGTINANHMEMCRFANKEDQGYKDVQSVIRHYVNLIKQESEKRKLEQWQAEESEKSECLQALFFDGLGEHQNEIEQPHPDTFQWVEGNAKLRDWMEGRSKVIWISGKLGSGKSTLAKYIFNSVKGENQQRGALASFFFHDRGRGLENSVNGFLRTLLYQLVRQNPSLFSLILPEFRAMRAKDSKLEWSIPFLKDTLLSIIRESEVGSIWLMIDAISECEDCLGSGSSLLDWVMFDLAGSSSSPHILITSRPDPTIGRRMAPHPTIQLQDHNAKDIAAYVESEFLSLIDNYDDFEAVWDLKGKVISQARGVFTWVKLLIQKLKQQTYGVTVQDLKDTLEELPPGLQGLYSRVFQKFDIGGNEEARRVFEWVLFARRPMTLSELRYAIAIGSPAHNFGSISSMEQSEVIVKTSSRMEQRLYKICGGLLEVVERVDDRIVGGPPSPSGTRKYQEESRIVQLVHDSVKDFLLEKEGYRSNRTAQPPLWIDPSEAQTHLARDSISYLTLSEFAQDPEESFKPPFLEYATRHWTEHVELAQGFGEGGLALMEKFDWPETQKFDVWRMLYKRFKHSDSWIGSFKTPLDVASRRGQLGDVRYLLAKIKRLPKYLRHQIVANSFIVAAVSEQEKVLGLLIDSDSDVNWKVRSHFERNLSPPTTLTRTFMSISQLREGNPMSGYYVKPVLAPEKTLQFLLPYALRAAAADGNEIAVELLVRKGVNPNVHGGGLASALQAAALEGYYNVVKLLLDNGAHVNCESGWDGYALHAAAVQGHEQVVQLLIDNGADVNALGGWYWTALQAAAARGHEKVVQLLINNGADLDAQGGRHGNAFHAATVNGHQQVVKLLVDAGVDPNIEPGSYQNFLNGQYNSEVAKMQYAAFPKGFDNWLRSPDSHNTDLFPFLAPFM